MRYNQGSWKVVRTRVLKTQGMWWNERAFQNEDQRDTDIDERRRRQMERLRSTTTQKKVIENEEGGENLHKVWRQA